MNRTYEIEGMHCGACSAKIKAALDRFADDVQVSLSPPHATLTRPHADATTSALATAVASAGSYRLKPSLETSGAGKTQVREAEGEEKSWLATYHPLLLIAGYISVVALAGATSSTAWMTNFMAGFFLVFSAFKFLDLKGFADAYSTYDLLAKRWHGYGFVYPFLELALGLAYLFRLDLFATNLATVLLMGFSSLGVLDALRNKRKIQCACLGTVLNLPMSTITLVEDAGMAVMALAMLIAGHN